MHTNLVREFARPTLDDDDGIVVCGKSNCS